MKIINIKQKNKQTTNCIVYLINSLEENINIELSIDLIVRENLNKGIEISDLLYNKLLTEQRIIDAKQIAFNFISYRKRSKQQIVEKLKQKYFTENEINLALDYLQQNKLLDDEIFAQCFVKDILLTKKIGRNKVFNLLYSKGISKEIITKVLDDFFPNNNLENAIFVAERKYNLIKHKPIEKIKTSIFNHLISKGFSFDETKKAMEIVLYDK